MYTSQKACFTIRYYKFLINLNLRGYHTLQGDNSLKSVERFDHMMFVCSFQASQWSKPQKEKLLHLYVASEFIALSLLVGICLNFWYLLQWIYSNTLPKKKKKIKRADQILPEVYGTTLIQQISYTQCISFI
jgi:hypothetical protein